MILGGLCHGTIARVLTQPDPLWCVVVRCLGVPLQKTKGLGINKEAPIVRCGVITDIAFEVTLGNGETWFVGETSLQVIATPWIVRELPA